jgi:Fe-S-cluster-containing hydrogenase component 2
MAPLAEKPGINSLWGWLLTGIGREPGVSAAKVAVAGKDKVSQVKKAVKCDMCKDLKSGPACVRACPTGAALRISPEKFLDYAGGNN